MAEGGWNDCRRPGNGKWFVWNEGSISLFAFPYPSQPSTVLSLFLHIPSLFPHLPHTTPHTTSPCRLLRHIPFHAPCPPRSCLRSNSSLAFVSSSQVNDIYIYIYVSIYIYIEVSINGVPPRWMVDKCLYNGTSQLEVDDDWGSPISGNLHVPSLIIKHGVLENGP